jgi:DNA-binding NtrC family response regulator
MFRLIAFQNVNEALDETESKAWQKLLSVMTHEIMNSIARYLPLLKTEAKEVVTEKNPENLRWLMSQKTFDLILLDMNFNSSINTGNEGLFWLQKIKELKPDVSVIMITAYGDIDLAVRSLKEGAADFVVKPWHNEKLIITIKDALGRKGSSKAAVPRVADADMIIGNECLANLSQWSKCFSSLRKLPRLMQTSLYWVKMAQVKTLSQKPFTRCRCARISLS